MSFKDVFAAKVAEMDKAGRYVPSPVLELMEALAAEIDAPGAWGKAHPAKDAPNPPKGDAPHDDSTKSAPPKDPPKADPKPVEAEKEAPAKEAPAKDKLSEPLSPAKGA